MLLRLTLITLLASLLESSVIIENRNKNHCIVTSIDQIENTTKQCMKIIIEDIIVPTETTLNLKLKRGAELRFQGIIKFKKGHWKGPLMRITGSNITVKGEPGSLFDGQGELYWGNEGTKPKFLKIQADHGSIIQDIHLRNCPCHCTSISHSNNIILTGWNIDSLEGDFAGGKNTDGFDISSSSWIKIENSTIRNQDDCVAINLASNVHISGLYCSGGHGLSLSVGLSKNDPKENVVKDVLIENCTVVNSRNGIHVKTHSDATTGAISNVTYSNIRLYGITRYGVNIEQNYVGRSGPSGDPKGNIPISGLVLDGISGAMKTSKKAMPVYILCGADGCKNWRWSKVSITGEGMPNTCNFLPKGFEC